MPIPIKYRIAVPINMIYLGTERPGAAAVVDREPSIKCPCLTVQHISQYILPAGVE